MKTARRQVIGTYLAVVLILVTAQPMCLGRTPAARSAAAGSALSTSQVSYFPLRSQRIRWPTGLSYIVTDAGLAGLSDKAPIAAALRCLPLRHPPLFGFDVDRAGKRLAFSSVVYSGPETWQVLSISPVGTFAPRRLVEPRQMRMCVAPSWEPGGDSICFVAFQTVHDAMSGGSPTRRSLCTVDLHNGRLRTLVRQGLLSDRGYWAPAGRRILVSVLADPANYLSASRTVVVDALTAHRTAVRIKSVAGYDAYDASWAPNGREIVFSVAQAEDGPRTGLFVYDTRTKRASVLIPVERGGGPTRRSPSWAPDGTRVAFVENSSTWPEQPERIVTVDRASRRQTVVTVARWGGENFTSLAWSPDSRWIAYWSESWSASGLYRVSARGGLPAVRIVSAAKRG